MVDNSTNNRQPTEAERREQRLKAALKSNMARRKAQSRARQGETQATSAQNPEVGQEKDDI